MLILMPLQSVSKVYTTMCW